MEGRRYIKIKENRENLIAEELHLPNLYRLEMFCGIKQTEKAIYGMFYIGYESTGHKARRRCKWIPKSWIEDADNVWMIEDYDTAVIAFQNEYDQ